MSSNRDYCITLTKEICVPETDRWSAGRTDVIFCRDYQLDEQEVSLFDCNNGHQYMILSRDIIASIIEDEAED